jgi:hypothetical protein
MERQSWTPDKNGFSLCQLPDFYVTGAVEAGRLIGLLPSIEPSDESGSCIHVSRKYLTPTSRGLSITSGQVWAEKAQYD